jgi:hypothetical protein
MKMIYKISHPTGKIYIDKDFTGSTQLIRQRPQ